MKTKRISALLFTVLLLSVSITACSNNEDEEKSSIEQFTDKTAHDAVNQIQAPIDKAKAVQELVNQQQEEVRKTAEELK